jgi:hypothetical protein
MANLKFSPKVQRVMQGENISADEMLKMVSRSCVTSLQGFNRRFCHWLLLVQDNEVFDMRVNKKIPTFGFGTVRQEDDHLECLGQGCKKCGWSGITAIRWIKDKPIPKHEPLVLVNV